MKTNPQKKIPFKIIPISITLFYNIYINFIVTQRFVVMSANYTAVSSEIWSRYKL
jgi:hypothetical protein